MENIPVAGRGDEVEQRMDTVVSEARVTLDARLLSQNVVVLSLKVADDLAKAGLVVDLVAEAGGVDNSQGDAGALLIKLKLCSN